MKNVKTIYDFNCNDLNKLYFHVLTKKTEWNNYNYRYNHCSTEIKSGIFRVEISVEANGTCNGKLFLIDVGYDIDSHDDLRNGSHNLEQKPIFKYQSYLSDIKDSGNIRGLACAITNINVVILKINEFCKNIAKEMLAIAGD